MDERSEVFLYHAVHALDENGVLGLEQLVGWVSPFFNRLFDELPGDHKWIIIGELSCLRPRLGLSD